MEAGGAGGDHEGDPGRGPACVHFVSMAAVAVATTGLRGTVDDSIAINHLLCSGLYQRKHTIKNRASTGIGSVLCLLFMYANMWTLTI